MPFPFAALAQPIFGAAVDFIFGKAEKRANHKQKAMLAALKQEVVGDPEAKQEFTKEMANVLANSDQAQNELNKLQARSPSLFIAGPRPAAMWLGVLGMFYEYTFRPCVIIFTDLTEQDVPSLDPVMREIIIGTLGLGVFRSYDKQRGTDTKGILSFLGNK